ncbi:MAG TPA: hypothetical protein VNP96_05315 [Solirubrobacterales bacterium]|nr:hypothetical protein [Solirubrobacterales bacterium]
MSINWKLVQNGDSPASVRDCPQMAIVAVDNAPILDLLSALTPVGEGFAIATYARSALAVKLERVLGQVSGSIDHGFFGAWRDVNRRTRTACVQGGLRVGDGRLEPAFFGGHARLLEDVLLWENDELPHEPVQLARLREYESAEVDVVEFPPSATVNKRFTGLNLVQPVVLSLSRLREAEVTGRIVVKWEPQ